MNYSTEKKTIIITTINYPSDMIKSFFKFKDFELIVVGDKKTPEDWHLNNTIFIDVKKQNNKLGQKLPFNSYSRKNLGYLLAIENKTQWLVDTDDDTAQEKPINNFLNINICEKTLSASSRFVNSYRVYGKGTIWPRGFPLNFIFDLPEIKKPKEVISPVKQFMIAGDTDVDAIYRLTNKNLNFKWKSNKSYILEKNNYCPFNSQATLWNRVAFPLLYIPSTTTMRTCDILRGYVAQRCMREKNWYLSFGPALFYQNRNPHNYINDFIDEIPVYLQMEKVVYELNQLKLSGDILNDLKKCYKMLVEKFQSIGLVNKFELEVLEVWLESIKGYY